MTSLLSYFHLSQVGLSSAHKSELRLLLPFTWPKDLAHPEHIYLYQHHTYVPYGVQKWRASGRTVLVSLSAVGLLARERMDRGGYALFLSWEWLRTKLDAIDLLKKLIFCEGFKVVNTDGDILGTAESVQPRKIQPLFIVSGEDGTVLDIPVHEKFIRSIDIDNRSVTVVWSP